MQLLPRLCRYTVGHALSTHRALPVMCVAQPSEGKELPAGAPSLGADPCSSVVVDGPHPRPITGAVWGVAWGLGPVGSGGAAVRGPAEGARSVLLRF